MLLRKDESYYAERRTSTHQRPIATVIFRNSSEKLKQENLYPKDQTPLQKSVKLVAASRQFATYYGEEP
jgi:hypothetical protein